MVNTVIIPRATGRQSFHLCATPVVTLIVVNLCLSQRLMTARTISIGILIWFARERYMIRRSIWQYTCKHSTSRLCSAQRSAVLCSGTQHSTGQHSTAQHSTALHCTALHCTALHSIAQHCTAQLTTAQHRHSTGTAQTHTAQNRQHRHSTAQHSSAQTQHSTAQHSSAQLSSAQLSTAHLNILYSLQVECAVLVKAGDKKNVKYSLKSLMRHDQNWLVGHLFFPCR